MDLTAAKEALRATHDRRSSLLGPVDFKEENPPKIDDPWEISCKEQAVQFAQDHPDQFYDWLVALASERDDFRRHTQQLESLHEIYKELQDEKKDLEASVTKADDKAAQWRTKSIVLQTQLDELDKAALAQTRRAKDPSQKSIKLPEPPVFTDGKNPTWDEWSSQAREKLSVNHDHFTTENSKTAWVLSRVGGDAATHTFHRRQPKAEDPYVSYEDVFEHLAEIYEDTDRLENSRRTIMKLQLGERPFKAFVADFQRFGYAAKLAEDHLIQLLREKLPPRLLKPMLAQNAVTQFTSLKELKDYLVRLDNSQSHDLPAKSKVSKLSVTKSPRDTVRKTSTVETSRRPAITRVPVCYNCGEIGHFKNDKKKCLVDH